MQNPWRKKTDNPAKVVKKTGKAKKVKDVNKADKRGNNKDRRD